MSVQPIHINVIDKNYKQNLSTEDYEKFTFKNLKPYIKKKDDFDTSDQNNTNLSIWKHLLKLSQTLQSLMKWKSNKTQLENFQSSMNMCLISGQCLGLFPIIKITDKDLPQARYNIFSWRYLVCYLIFLGQFIIFCLTFYRMITSNISLSSFAYVLFCMTNCVMIVCFIRFSRKWYYLVKLVATSDLNEYVDPYVKFKCNFATILLLGVSFIEHILGIISKLFDARECFFENTYEQVIVRSFSFIFELNVPYTMTFGVTLQVFTLMSTLIWSYSHLFIICICLYLTPLLELLNKKIVSREGEHLPASYWRALREDYNRATRLIRSFDDAINSIVFISIGSNLFFVCSQLYYFIGYDAMIGASNICPEQTTGSFHQFKNVIYTGFSLVYLILRTFMVLLIMSRIHTASLVAAPSLYNVPSSSYCTEVQRFIEQIHGDTVALTGLNFFYVTKELILSVVGTIVTYELVLLQFNDHHADNVL